MQQANAIASTQNQSVVTAIQGLSPLLSFGYTELTSLNILTMNKFDKFKRERIIFLRFNAKSIKVKKVNMFLCLIISAIKYLALKMHWEV